MLQFCTTLFCRYWLLNSKMFCIPESGGQTVTCSTLLALDAVKHKNSYERRKNIDQFFMLKKAKNKAISIHTKTHLPDKSKGPIKAPGISVLPDFVVEPSELCQSAAGVSQRFTQHHLLAQTIHYYKIQTGA